jgi:ADP-ribosyl-[dinitrogen reductase] hydrolase
MRLGPVAIWWCNDLPNAVAKARLQSSVTHNTPEALDASAFLAEMIVRAIQGEPKEAILVSRQEFSHPLIRDLSCADAAWISKAPEVIRTLPGRASLSLEAAMWCVHRTHSFKEAILLAVSLGGDADTIAAITGQIAGALYGASAISEEWLNTLKYHDIIALKASALYHHESYQPDFDIPFPK